VALFPLKGHLAIFGQFWFSQLGGSQKDTAKHPTYNAQTIPYTKIYLSQNVSNVEVEILYSSRNKMCIVYEE
jgi:hypothetical protein